ncbi:MAG: SUMF1/EgtB/PvdO family nonheme iron enzyme, partial [Treponema sp.]|nr:SUMF1/EgtB/PvdO family nonheme iron enzyme [Treponema sp.]
VTLTVVPDPGFRLKPNSLRYTGENGVVQDINKDSLRFTMPGSHVTVCGEFDAAVYSVTFDPSMSGGKITADILEGPAGTPVTLRVIADKGFRYEPGSLKYRYAQGGETAIDGKSLRFNLPAGNVIVGAKFINSTLLKNLRVNGGPPVTLIDGKTDYTVWVSGGNTASAVITFDTEPGTTVKPASGTAHPLGSFENPPVHYTVTPKDGMTKIVYTLTMIKEMIPTAPVNGGVFRRDGNRFNTSEVSAFRMGMYEVTQAEWYTVMKYYRGAKRGDRLPVSDIRWYEAIKFCNELSILEKKTPVYSVNGETDPAKWGSVPSSGTDPAWNVVPAWNVNGYRLPTEMEWLWAAMGADFRSPGKSNTEGYGYGFAGTKIFSDADRFAWFDVNSGGDVCETGSKEANEIGLYDMSGNVREWCWDRFAFPGGSNNEDSSRYQFSIPGTRKDYTGPNTGNYRMTRGGHYSSDAKELVLSYRGGGKYYPAPFMLPHENRNEAGMRIVCRDY